MLRRALIVHCGNTSSGRLAGPPRDNENYRALLMSKLGGDWFHHEILSLPDPTKAQVVSAVKSHLSGADYCFTIFSGHGYILDSGRTQTQYLELVDGDVSVNDLISNARKQTIIVDACRGIFRPTDIDVIRSLGHLEEKYFNFTGSASTRTLFDDRIRVCESGLTVLYAASSDESAMDTNNGGAYLLSLLRSLEIWGNNDRTYNIMPLDVAHERATSFMYNNFVTNQVPTTNQENRTNYFPIAVKFT